MDQNKLPAAFGPVSVLQLGEVSLPFYHSVNWMREEKIEETAQVEETQMEPVE